jgi:hypothetical protein
MRFSIQPVTPFKHPMMTWSFPPASAVLIFTIDNIQLSRHIKSHILGLICNNEMTNRSRRRYLTIRNKAPWDTYFLWNILKSSFLDGSNITWIETTASILNTASFCNDSNYAIAHFWKFDGEISIYHNVIIVNRCPIRVLKCDWRMNWK